MKAGDLPAGAAPLALGDLFGRRHWPIDEPVVTTGVATRLRQATADGAVVVQRDEFTDLPGLACGFVRIATGAAAQLGFVAEGAYRMLSCAAGGWLLEAVDPARDSYWIPALPMLRTFDPHQRVLVEQEAAVSAFGATEGALEVAFDSPPGLVFTWAVWRIAPQAREIGAELLALTNLERTRSYLWNSQSTIGLPAELYAHLIDGWVYQNARAWPRKWKFCCDLDAYEIFLRFSGLEDATGKRLYRLLRLQLMLSTLARQSADGGWYHGEWTDQNECHVRFMAGAMLLLESALDEWPDAAVRAALARGADFIAARADRTDLGLWFLHDSVEESAAAMDEMHRQTGAIVKHFGAWKPSRFLGKSATNKMILNTHVDATVVLQRHRQGTGDARHAEAIASALAATRRLLALRPAPWLYALVGRALRLTMLPADAAAKLSLPARVIRRLADRMLLPNLWRIKHRWPRIVMPGGFIDRHLGPLQFSPKYHPINIMDLVRLWRCFPDEPLSDVIDDAVRFVTDREGATLRWWTESRPRRFAIGAFGEALVQLCTLRPNAAYRHHLARVLMLDADLQQGLPPSLHGGNAEIVPRARQLPCPSAEHPALLVANLGTRERPELLVINPTKTALDLRWEARPPPILAWMSIDAQGAATTSDGMQVPPRGWLHGLAPAGDGGSHDDVSARGHNV
jgi:hypothetical protein